MKALRMMFVALALCVACDAGSSGGSERSGDSSVPSGGTGGSGGGGQDPGDAAMAECPFPSDFCDTSPCTYEVSVCEAACTNLSDALSKCSAAVDMAQCVQGCEFSITATRCSNILFGCASENDTCKSYRACQEDKFNEPAPPKDAGSDAS